MGVLDEQVAIVTGAGSGIGREAAKLLAAEGAQVVVTGRRPEPLDAVVAELEKAGGRAAARTVDIEDREAAVDLVRWTIKTSGAWTCSSTTPAIRAAPGRSAGWRMTSGMA